MKRVIMLSAALVVALTALFDPIPRSVADPPTNPTAPSFQDVTPAFRHLFPAGTKVEKLATGFKFTEHPLWNADGYLLFTAIGLANLIYKWSPEAGVTIFRKTSTEVGGLTYDRERRLIACQDGMITRTEADGTVKTLTSAIANDMVVKSDGAIYFTGGSPYVYRLGLDGKRTTIAKDFGYANGIAFSPDEKLLYLIDSEAGSKYRGEIRAYEVADDGTLANRRAFTVGTASPTGDGPDGMKVDRSGNIYCAWWKSGLRVFDAKGTHLGTLQLGEPVINCAWGDADGRSLYMTALTSLYRVRVQTKGILP